MKSPTAQKIRDLERSISTVEVKLQLIGEGIKDLRDDIDYLFRALGKIEQREEEEEYD